MSKAMTGISLAAALALMLTPATALAQRGTSPSGESATAETSMPPSASCPMDGTCRMEQTGQRGQPMGMQRGQTGQRGQAMGMQGGASASPANERQRLEQMQARMVEHMRRMAFHMTAIQERLEAIDRGEDPPPMPAMGGMGGGMGRMGGNGRAAQSGQGRGMRLMEGSGAGCPAGGAMPDAATTEGETP